MVHASLWHDNQTQLGVLHYVLPLSHTIIDKFTEVNYVMINDGWNMNMMREMFGEEICDHVITNFGTSPASNERDKP